MSKVEMYFNNGDKVFRFPILPTELQRDINASYDREVVQCLGEVARFNSNNLAEIPIEAFFPALDFPYKEYPNCPSPAECIAHFKDMKNKGLKGRFILTGGHENINQEMYIESFTYYPANIKGIPFSISLVEARNIELPNITKPSGGSATVGGGAVNNNRPSENNPTQKTYKVQHGDSLWSISQKFYGDGSKYTKIKEANISKYPSLKNNNVIYSQGDKAMELIIP